MTLRVFAFFQHMPPYSGAAALRGHSVIGGMVSLARFRECDIRVFTTTPATTPLQGATIITLDVPEVENAQGLASRMIGELRMGWSAARAMFPRREGCEIAIISSPGFLAALVTSSWARWRKIPYVLEMRDVYPQVYAEASLISRTSLPYRFLAHCSRKMYRGASLVIAATQGLAREVLSAEPGAHVACVYNGFPQALRERKGAKHPRFTVCFHGVLGFFQDVDTLLEVARRLSEHEVDVVVIGYGRKEDPLRQSRLPNLRFLGRLSFGDTVAEVERCHVGLCLRLDDGISKDAFPVKIWEYLGLAIPSIVTPRCEAGEFLQTHRCGMHFAAGDVDGVVDAVLDLKRDPAAVHILADNCRAVGALYTREHLGVSAARLVAEVLDRHVAQAGKAAS